MDISVCRKIDPDKSHCLDPQGKEHYNLTVLETIDRKPFNKGFMGNFVPHWARYKGKEYLVHGSIDYAYMHGFDNDAYIVID